jgi:hypothetical protein
VWKRFVDLQRGDSFYVGKTLVQKTGLLTARGLVNVSCYGRELPVGDLHVFFKFWTRVKTTQLVRDARPGGKSSQDLVCERRDTCPAGEVNNAEHFDACRAADAEVIQVAATEPNNDNNVTGPTS